MWCVHHTAEDLPCLVCTPHSRGQSLSGVCTVNGRGCSEIIMCNDLLTPDRTTTSFPMKSGGGGSNPTNVQLIVLISG